MYLIILQILQVRVEEKPQTQYCSMHKEGVDIWKIWIHYKDVLLIEKRFLLNISQINKIFTLFFYINACLS